MRKEFLMASKDSKPKAWLLHRGAVWLSTQGQKTFHARAVIQLEPEFSGFCSFSTPEFPRALGRSEALVTRMVPVLDEHNISARSAGLLQKAMDTT